MTLPFVRSEDWLQGLRGKVNLKRISTPIKVEKEEQIEVTTGGGKKQVAVGQYDFSFNFRGTDGRDLRGSGRLFVPIKRPREHLPMVVSMHYEMDANGSSRFLSKGVAVMTPHGPRSYTASNLLGHGINHSIAMAQLPRRMPFVDQNRVLLFGGSAGGFHALMASSFIFPATAVFAAVPIVNLKYNINYLLRNDKFNVNQKDPDKPPAPIVKIVHFVAADTAKGGGPDAQSWEYFSPVFRTHLITFPTLMTFSTADALVPIQQLSKDLVQRPPRGLWPKGFSFAMGSLVPNRRERLSLLDVLKQRDYHLKVVKIPRDSPTLQVRREEITQEETSKITTNAVEWSRTKRFSIFVLDEGYPEPFCGHTKYHHNLNDSAFFKHHFSQPSLGPGILTMEKMVQLMERFSGIEPDQGSEYDEKGSWSISRRDHDHIERWYVANGLEIYLNGGPKNAARLVSLYGRLPRRLKVLDLDDGKGRFQKNPLIVLRYHQMTALIECGDLKPTTHIMRMIISKGKKASLPKEGTFQR